MRPVRAQRKRCSNIEASSAAGPVEARRCFAQGPESNPRRYAIPRSMLVALTAATILLGGSVAWKAEAITLTGALPPIVQNSSPVQMPAAFAALIDALAAEFGAMAARFGAARG